MTWRSPYLDLALGRFVPQLVTWDPETAEFTRVEGPKGLVAGEEAEDRPGAGPAIPGATRAIDAGRRASRGRRRAPASAACPDGARSRSGGRGAGRAPLR